MKKILSILLAAALMFSLAACGGKDSDNSDDYAAFTKAMTDVRSEGTKLTEQGLDFQAQSLYAFSGASLSALRYAVEYILWLKGEGESIDDVTEGSRYTGWDEIAAICYASPYPYYFEGLLYQIQGEDDNAKPCYTAALLNPAYPEDGVDFYYLKNMEVSDLYNLRDELREQENAVYDLFTPRPVVIPRDEFNFYPEYLRAKSSEALRAGSNPSALAYAKVAVLNDPFEPLNYRNAVLCAIAAEDSDSAATYLDAGLLIAPEDEGLKTLYAGFETLAGGKN